MKQASVAAAALLAAMPALAQTTDLNTALGEQVTMVPSTCFTDPEVELTYCKPPARSDRTREGHERWLRADSPKAFAIHPTLGSWASTTGGARPMARALANCDKFAIDRAAALSASGAAQEPKMPCRLYAMDDAVVWTTSP
jgi:hypothetical protein